MEAIPYNSDWYNTLRDNLDKRFSAIDRFQTFVRDLGNRKIPEAHKYDYLVEFFANEILGPYDQDISLLIVGNKGRGKSLTALSMSYYTACEIASRLGGKWTDYFNPDTNMAVILETEANSVMSIQKKYQVKNYDDIGIGWGARNWQDSDNKNKNDVFQINRTDSTLQIFSVPNQFLLDKVPRSLVSHYAEMAQQFFEHGFTTIKMFEPETLFREGKIVQPYLNTDRTKYVLFRVPKPPDDLVAYYKERRKANKELATRKRMEGEEYPNTPVPPEKVRKNPATMAMEQEMMGYSGPVMASIKEGGQDKDILQTLLDAGVETRKAKRWVKHQLFKQLFPH